MACSAHSNQHGDAQGVGGERRQSAQRQEQESPPEPKPSPGEREPGGKEDDHQAGTVDARADGGDDDLELAHPDGSLGRVERYRSPPRTEQRRGGPERGIGEHAPQPLRGSRGSPGQSAEHQGHQRTAPSQRHLPKGPTEWHGAGQRQEPRSSGAGHQAGQRCAGDRRGSGSQELPRQRGGERESDRLEHQSRPGPPRRGRYRRRGREAPRTGACHQPTDGASSEDDRNGEPERAHQAARRAVGGQVDEQGERQVFDEEQPGWQRQAKPLGVAT